MTGNTEITEIYATYVSALLHNEGKRQNANQIYLTISLAVITAYSTIEGFPKMYAVSMIGFVAVIWVLTILFYRNLARAKFKVLLEMEKQLAFDPFTKEWAAMPSAHRKVGLTRLEVLAPFVLIAFAAIVYFSP